jgi:hypothetical protein
MQTCISCIALSYATLDMMRNCFLFLALFGCALIMEAVRRVDEDSRHIREDNRRIREDMRLFGEAIHEELSRTKRCIDRLAIDADHADLPLMQDTNQVLVVHNPHHFTAGEWVGIAMVVLVSACIGLRVNVALLSAYIEWCAGFYQLIHTSFAYVLCS